MSIVAANDGVQGFDPNAVASPTNSLDIARLVQVGKLIKIDNVHLPLFAIPTGRLEIPSKPGPRCKTILLLAITITVWRAQCVTPKHRASE